MSGIEYNLQFERLCNILELGEIVDVPKVILGGLLHKMYEIKTTQGKYAVKALNPQIMHRSTAKQNYIHSERIANIIVNNNIAALPAKKLNHNLMQEIDNQFYLVFDWVNGKSLKLDEINKVHCAQIGAILADIHRTDFTELRIENSPLKNVELTDWNYYLQKGQETNIVWANLLLEIIDKLYEWNAQTNNSTRHLGSDMVISHRDLDPKNVIWDYDEPMLIDWEAAGYINPMQELIETAIYWSENEIGYTDKERFMTFVTEYRRCYGTLQANWGIVLAAGFQGKLGWLEYSLKRSLWIECTDNEEQQMGTTQVIGTINAIRRYADMIPVIEQWLNDIKHIIE